MIAGYARQPVKSEVIFFFCLVAIPGFQEADNVLVKVAPPSCIAAMAVYVLLESVGIALPKWHRQVAGQDVVESRNVGRSLNAGVSAEGKDASAWPADISEEKLENAGGTDDLHTCGMLCPTDGVANGSGFFWPRSIREYLCHF